MMKKIAPMLSLALLLLPVLAIAGSPIRNANFSWVQSVVLAVGTVVTDLIPLLIGIALLVFVWGVVKFISTDEDSARNDGKRKMMWGVVGLFVIISAWGLVYLLQTLLGISGAVELSNYPRVPDIRTTTSV